MPNLAARKNVTPGITALLGKPVRSSVVRAALARNPGKGNPRKFLALLDTLPPGDMTGAEIDREIEEVRGDWGR